MQTESTNPRHHRLVVIVRGCIILPLVALVLLLVLNEPLRLGLIGQLMSRVDVCPSNASLVLGSYQSSYRNRPDGVTVIYTAECEVQGRRQRVLGMDHYQGWGIGGGGSSAYGDPQPQAGNPVEYIIAGGQGVDRTHSTVYGRTFDPRIATVEVIYANGRQAQDQPIGGLFAVSIDEYVAACEIILRDDSGASLQRLPLPPGNLPGDC
jgi:hypothetical protein